ncbi:MAG: hypothetical protein WAK93_15180 [Solirubrobacteraceae bacterium]
MAGSSRKAESSRNGSSNSKDGGSNSKDGGSNSKQGAPVSPWRAPFDVVEKPVTRASQSWLQSKTFMDGLSVGWRLQRRARIEVRRGLGYWLGAWSLPSRGDIDRLSNQLANVERELRTVRAQVERSGSESLPLASAPARRRPTSRGSR